MTKIQIITPDKMDLPALVKLGRKMHEESAYKKFEYNERLVHFFLENSIADEQRYIRTAVIDGEFIGGIVGGLVPYFFCDEHYIEEYSVFIDPVRRGGYAATKLIADFERWGKARKAREICLKTSTKVNMKRTHDLYVHLGYTVHGGVYKKEIK